jgi:hypothetical protein
VAANSSSCRRKLDRYNINLLAHSTCPMPFTPFVEAKYSRTDSVGHRQFGSGVHPGRNLWRSGAILRRTALGANNSVSTTRS